MSAVLGLVALRASSPIDNYDTWFHLRIGREFSEGSWSIQHPQTLSSFATAHWVPTQWASEILMWQVEHWFGLPGLAWLFGLVYLAFVVLVYSTCRRMTDPLSAAIPTALVVLGAFYQFSARPQSISLVFLSATLFAWMGSLGDGRPRWWLVPMTWVWATAHGFWSVGLLVGLVCWLGIVADGERTRAERTRLLGVFLLSAAVCLATPLGPRLVGSQFVVLDRSHLSPEWAATDFHNGPAACVALMIGLVVVLWARQDRQGWSMVMLLVMASALTIYSVRFVALGAVIVAPLLSRGLAAARRPPPAHGKRAEVVTLCVVGVVSLVGLGLAVPRTADAPAAVPLAITARMQRLPAGTPVIDESLLGGWLEYSSPRLNPVIDGLLDSYSVAWGDQVAGMFRLDPGWEHFVAHTGARVAVLYATSRLVPALEEVLGWREVAQDHGWVYLVAPQSGPGG